MAEGFGGCGVAVGVGAAGCSATAGADVGGVSTSMGSGVGACTKSKTGGNSKGWASSGGGSGLVRSGLCEGASGSSTREGGRTGAGASGGSYFAVSSTCGGRPRSLRRSVSGAESAWGFARRAFPAGSNDISGSGVSKSTFWISAKSAAFDVFFFLLTRMKRGSSHWPRKRLGSTKRGGTLPGEKRRGSLMARSMRSPEILRSEPGAVFLSCSER